MVTVTGGHKWPRGESKKFPLLSRRPFQTSLGKWTCALLMILLALVSIIDSTQEIPAF